MHFRASLGGISGSGTFNTLRLRQNGRRFADDTFKRIFVNESVRSFIKISLKFVPKGPINNITALIQIMAWRRPGDKPLSEPMMVKLPTHICVTRPQWVKRCRGEFQRNRAACTKQRLPNSSQTTSWYSEEILVSDCRCLFGVYKDNSCEGFAWVLPWRAL